MSDLLNATRDATAAAATPPTAASASRSSSWSGYFLGLDHDSGEAPSPQDSILESRTPRNPVRLTAASLDRV
jgi:hypothetical protein